MEDNKNVDNEKVITCAFSIQDALDKHEQGFDVTHDADTDVIIITKSPE